MLEMLQRLEEEDTPLTDEADSTTASLEERLSGLDLGMQVVCVPTAVHIILEQVL